MSLNISFLKMFSFSSSNAELPLHCKKWTTLCHKVSNGKRRDIFVSYRPFFFFCNIAKMFLIYMWASQNFRFIKIAEIKYFLGCFFPLLLQQHISLDYINERSSENHLNMSIWKVDSSVMLQTVDATFSQEPDIYI